MAWPRRESNKLLFSLKTTILEVDTAGLSHLLNFTSLVDESIFTKNKKNHCFLVS